MHQLLNRVMGSRRKVQTRLHKICRFWIHLVLWDSQLAMKMEWISQETKLLNQHKIRLILLVAQFLIQPLSNNKRKLINLLILIYCYLDTRIQVKLCQSQSLLLLLPFLITLMEQHQHLWKQLHQILPTCLVSLQSTQRIKWPTKGNLNNHFHTRDKLQLVPSKEQDLVTDFQELAWLRSYKCTNKDVKTKSSDTSKEQIEEPWTM